MLRYAIQNGGCDFEPASAWTTNAQQALTLLQAAPDAKLLVWNPQNDHCEIYPQHDQGELTDKIEHTAYARLMAQMRTVAKPIVDAQLQAQWYLVAELAVLSHQSPINTAAALLALTVQRVKRTSSAPGQLRGLADQARCWLLAAHVTDLQLVATTKPLATLLPYLTAQSTQLDVCGGRSRAWQLAHDALVLSEAPVALTTLELPVAWELLRVAQAERHHDGRC
ncbi:hypothetical protein [Lactiplantibacillus modestisalitolerans]|uniref:Uncharacterized protein n=1 Tax=Lactiplantibacillus modestisalitolerans TaxID=1457219 RepID=A0ABV5WXW5_9LACO|nr:hypothetical protein [Lactiplantibacillus modestisalitolerans]